MDKYTVFVVDGDHAWFLGRFDTFKKAREFAGTLGIITATKSIEIAWTCCRSDKESETGFTEEMRHRRYVDQG